MKSYLFPIRPLFHSLPALRARVFKSVVIAGAALVMLGSAPTAANEEPVESQEGEILAVIRVPGPRELTEKILAVARKVQPGPQTEALPFMLGGMLGDPTLEGISATDNIGLALFAHGTDVTPVLLLKLTEESPLRDSLPNFEMSLSDFGGWTFGLPEDVSAALIEGRQEALIAAVRAPRRYDLEFTADGPVLARKLREAYQNFPDMGGMAQAFLGPLMKGLAAEADAVADFRIGFDLSAELIQLGYFMKAVEGSAMANLFQQKRPANMDFARFIRADEAVAFLGGIDVQATRQYVEHFFDALSRGAEGAGAEIWGGWRDLTLRYLNNMDGRSGGVLSIDGMALQMTSIAPSSMTDEELLAMLGKTVEAMGQLMGEAEDDSPMPTYELLPNQAEVDGVAVHVLRTEIKLDPQIAADMEEEAPGFKMPDERQDMHYALVGGYLVNASDVSRMRELIGAIQKDQPVENNLASLIQVDEDNLFEFRVDLLRYIGGIMSMMMPPDMVAVLQQLEGRNLRPMTGKATAQGGAAELRLSLPVDTLAAIYQEMAAYMAAQQEQEEEQEEEFDPASP